MVVSQALYCQMEHCYLCIPTDDKVEYKELEYNGQRYLKPNFNKITCHLAPDIKRMYKKI